MQSPPLSPSYPVPERFRFDSLPLADEKAMVHFGKARFTVLSSRLLRLEFSPASVFEDRATALAWFRKRPVPAFEARTRGMAGQEAPADGNASARTLTLETEFLELIYDEGHEDDRENSGAAGFSASNLRIRLKQGGMEWKPGLADPENLKGPLPSVDNKAGAVALPDGILSKRGFGMVDDSGTAVFGEDGWPRERGAAPGSRDLYFFGHGRDYAAAIKDYCSLSGRMPLPPKWVLGNWWSKYWAYEEQELLDLMEEFRRRNIPLTVCVLDMDWHVVKNAHHGGWTGYSWNRNLFPDPAAFLGRLRAKGLRISLNLHPGMGVHPHEEAYAEFRRFMGGDPADGKPVDFDIADPRFAEGYFRFLHHPQEQAGVDLWWMDHGMGKDCRIPGLDDLWMLNHLHYLDSAKEGRRPLAFSRWAGHGSHRYPIGFSGDAHVTWKALRFQPYLTAASANLAFPFFSHDIGGHFHGKEDPELYLRWVQFGLFSPVLRLHSVNSRFAERLPWKLGAEALEIAGFCLRLRHALIPYLYSEMARGFSESIPFIRPLYHAFPEDERSYHCEGQYLFGSGLLVAPFCRPRDSVTRLTAQKVFLPPGGWRHFVTGEYFAGDRLTRFFGALSEMPVFAPEGAIIPMTAPDGNPDLANPAALLLKVFLGAEGAFDLYEDDGETAGHRRGESCQTRIRLEAMEGGWVLTVAAAEGRRDLIPPHRSWTVELFGAGAGAKAVLSAATAEAAPEGGDAEMEGVEYDARRECLTVRLKPRPTDRAFGLKVISQSGDLLSRRNRLAEKIGEYLPAFDLETDTKGKMDPLIPEFIRDPRALQAFHGIVPDSVFETLAEMIADMGFDIVDDEYGGKGYVQLWNNSGAEDLRYRFMARTSYESQGPIPRHHLIQADRNSLEHPERPAIWPKEGWNLIVDYFGIRCKALHPQPHF